jgi:hypothetical protein
MKKAWVVAAALGVTGYANADFFANFEAPTYSGSATGTLLTGQNGWTLPAAGPDYNVFTYAGNTPGFVANPNGGAQFISGASAGTTFARAQQAHNFGTRSLWTTAYDFAALWNGQGASAQNLGSFSLQSSTTERSFIALDVWADINNPSLGWHAQYNVFDAANVALNNQSPGAAWNNLQLNKWYRQSTTFNLATNSIVSVSITDLATNVTTTVNPTGWFLLGGATPTQPIPTAFRVFTGGAVGNVMGWDNISVVPEPASTMALGAGLVAMLVRKRRAR